jgi:uncharacterized SAM-binding protein YcdF (DUF218 family)
MFSDISIKVPADTLALGWILLVLASAVLLVYRRGKPAFVLLCLALAGSLWQAAAIPDRLVANWERPYLARPDVSLPTADAVLVLGGYLKPFSGSRLRFEAGESFDRLLTGVELARTGKARALVLSGGVSRDQNGILEGELARGFVSAWGVTSVPVYSIGAAANTHEEAVLFTDLARKNSWRRVLLVSSASHLRRAVAAFQKAGLEVTPVGCDFRATDRLAGNPKVNWIPHTSSLVMMRLWLEEELGYLWYYLRGWV